MKISIKKLTVLLTGLMLSIAAYASGPKLVIGENTHNFGMIREADGPVTFEFVLENQGDKPLVISSAKSQCGCTVPKIPKQPIRPGESAKISVTYDPAGRPGEFVKTIRVRTNEKGKSTLLKISGTVVPKKAPQKKD